MIDIHSHILYGIDDGSKTIEESKNIIKKLKKLGFTDIIVTPHYIEDSSFNSNEEKRLELLNEIQKESDVNLYLGNEVYIFDKVVSFIKNKEISTINNSKYILVEFPMETLPNFILSYIFDIQKNGYTVIVAHPERYKYFKEDPKKIKEFIDMGVLFQSNYASITNRYGKAAKKTFKYFLKHNYISFLGTDIHREKSSFYKKFKKMKRRIIRIIGKEKFKTISTLNQIKVLKNEDI